MEIAVAGESFPFYVRDLMKCIESLWANPDFLPHLAFAPERHYTSAEKTERTYSEMNTGKWWWNVQVHESDFMSAVS